MGGAQGSSGRCGCDLSSHRECTGSQRTKCIRQTRPRVCTAGRGAAGCLWEARGQPRPVLARGAQTPGGRGAGSLRGLPQDMEIHSGKCIVLYTVYLVKAFNRTHVENTVKARRS